MNLKKTLIPFSVIALSSLILSGCSVKEDTSKERAIGTEDNISEDKVPADKFDLTHWKIAIPTDSNNDGKVDEISVKDIQNFQHPDYFYLDAQGNMVFTTPNKAFTTPNSTNTRSELHQMIAGGKEKSKSLKNNFSLKANKRADEFGQIGGNLQATVKVNHVAKRAGYPDKAPAFSVVLGQIHAGKNKALVAENEGYGWGNEPLKIYYKKRPDQDYGSVFWNYERNLEKENPNRQDISYVVWGKSWLDSDNPGEKGIALEETFSYEVNVYENIMHLTFSTARHGTVNFEIDLANNIDANGNIDTLDHPAGYAGDILYFKAGAYDQCSIKDAPGFWYPKCLGTGDWAVDKANGDYAQVTFMRLVTGLGKEPK